MGCASRDFWPSISPGTRAHTQSRMTDYAAPTALPSTAAQAPPSWRSLRRARRRGWCSRSVRTCGGGTSRRTGEHRAARAILRAAAVCTRRGAWALHLMAQWCHTPEPRPPVTLAALSRLHVLHMLYLYTCTQVRLHRVLQQGAHIPAPAARQQHDESVHRPYACVQHASLQGVTLLGPAERGRFD